MLSNYDVIVPVPRNFYIISLYKHYVNSYRPYKEFLKEDLQQMHNAIKKLYPEYIPAFEDVCNRKKAHMLNMFIMKSVDYDKYCKWLFDIMFEIEMHVSEYREDTTRLCGALSEFLLDVYMRTNKMTFVERPLVELEHVPIFQRIVNRLKRMWS